MHRRRSGTSSRSSRSSSGRRPHPPAYPRGRRRRAWGRVRRGTEDDLPTLVAHRRAMFTDMGGRTERELDRHDRVFRRWATRELRARRFQAFLVEGPDGNPAGSGAIWLQPQQPRPGRLAVPFLPYIMSMYTVPERRGMGVATRLVRVMVRWAADRGYPRIFLHASRMGRPVYARAGFQDGNEMRLELPNRRSPRRGR